MPRFSGILPPDPAETLACSLAKALSTTSHADKLGCVVVVGDGVVCLMIRIGEGDTRLRGHTNYDNTYLLCAPICLQILLANIK